MMSLSINCFSISGIQYYISEILFHENEIFKLFFTFISISAPISGGIVGGTIIHLVGGYDKPKTL